MLLEAAFFPVFSTEKIYDGSSPGVQSCRGENCGLDFCGAGDGVETVKSTVSGGTAIKAGDDQFSSDMPNSWYCGRGIKLGRDVEREIETLVSLQ